MLCSVPAGKSTANWLDRLRTTRGFPTSSAVDLDHFLADPKSPDPSPPPDPSISDPAPPSQSSSGDGNSGKEWYGIMSDVLSELFIMGDPRPPKKSCRKQRNPRICPNFVKKDESLNSDSNSPEKTENWDNVGSADEEEEEEKLVGYSRSEVTVIDTSCENWKFEKVVFRRKNVWKVRDRKGKSRGGLRKKKKKKKRKLAAGDDDDAIVHGKKKHKVSNFESGSLNEGLDNPSGSPVICKSNKIVDTPPSRSPKMRFLGSVPPRKPRNRSSADRKKLKL